MLEGKESCAGMNPQNTPGSQTYTPSVTGRSLPYAAGCSMIRQLWLLCVCSSCPQSSRSILHLPSHSSSMSWKHLTFSVSQLSRTSAPAHPALHVLTPGQTELSQPPREPSPSVHHACLEPPRPPFALLGHGRRPSLICPCSLCPAPFITCTAARIIFQKF